MIWIGLIIVLGIMIILILNSIVIVPTFKVGLVKRFEKPTDKRLGPGLNFILPFIEDVLLETAGGEATTTELKKLPLEITVVSKDNQEIVVGGNLFFRLDPELISTFVNLGKDLLSGAINAIESDVGVIAGTQLGEKFIEERQAIQDLINSILRFKTPPHQEAKVKPEECLKFYREHLADVKPLFKEEKENFEDRSTVETRFGIDVETFELTRVTFSEEIMKAREQEQRAALEMKAAEEKRKKKMKIFEELKAKGVSDQLAINLAESTAGTAERKIISVEGSGSSLENAAAIIAAGGGKK